MTKTSAGFRVIPQRIAHYLWYKTAVPVFIERYLLAILATATFVLLVIDPMKFDRTQKVTFGIAALAFAYFLAHTVHLSNQASKTPTSELATPTPPPTPPPSPASAPSQSAPTLSGRIEQVNGGDALIAGKHIGSSVALVVSISNVGTPSIAREFRLIVETAGKEPFLAAPQHFGDKLILGGSPTVTIYGKDALYEKASLTPIPNGGEVRGVLFFIIKDIKASEIFRDGVILKIIFKDVTGKEYEISRPSSGRIVDPTYAPGINLEIKDPPESSKKRPKRK